MIEFLRYDHVFGERNLNVQHGVLKQNNVACKRLMQVHDHFVGTENHD